MTLNDLEMRLECRIQLKVRLVDGTLDVRVLRVSNSTICIVVARGIEGGWGGGPSPPPCGQLTRCFCAVAELLVSFLTKVQTHGGCNVVKTLEFYLPPSWILCEEYRIIGIIQVREHCVTKYNANVAGLKSPLLVLVEIQNGVSS